MAKSTMKDKEAVTKKELARKKGKRKKAASMAEKKGV
jgi:hypothetical protein